MSYRDLTHDLNITAAGRGRISSRGCSTMSHNKRVAHKWTRDEVELLVLRVGGDETARAIINDRMHVQLLPTPEEAIDPIVFVDRSLTVNYCDWTQDVLHPELESAGPERFDIRDLELWIHPTQKRGTCVAGNDIYEHLRSRGELDRCLSFRDLEEIQKKGLSFFRTFFSTEALFGWKSVVRDHNGYLLAPYICEYGRQVVVLWYWLVLMWYPQYAALRFK